MKITRLPQPPSSNDVDSFDVRADNFLSALPKFADELNDLAELLPKNIDKKQEEFIKQNEELFNNAKDEIKSEQQRFSKSLEEILEQEHLKLKASAALKSDSFDNICNDILLNLHIIKQSIEAESQKMAKIGEHKYFLRSSLPNGFYKAGDRLKITEHLFAFTLLKDILKAENGYFTLPASNLYIKGTNNIIEVGKFYDEGLPEPDFGEVFISSYTTGTLSNAQSAAVNRPAKAKLKAKNEIYGASKSVEVKRIHLLEAYYLG